MPNRFKGITELKSNQDYEKLVSEGSITDKDGVQHTYDQLGELYITDDAVEEELRSSITNLQNRVDDLETSIGEGSTDLTDINNSITQINEDITEINTTISDLSSDKLDKNQTTDNTGKLLNVSLDGNITTLDSGTAGQILQSNGANQAPTWIDIVNNKENVTILTGTNDNPINFATDMEVNHLYSCSGVFFNTISPSAQSSISGKTVNFQDQGRSFLFYKRDNTSVVCLASSHNTNSKTTVIIFSAMYGITEITFDSTTGELTNIRSGMGFGRVNGIEGNGNAQALGIYAPIESGSVGQILQSNGEGIAPTWVNLSENNLIRLTGTETDPIDILTDIEAGNLYLCSGYIHLSKQSTTAIDLGTNYILIYMQNDAPAGGFTLIRILDTIFEDNSAGGSFSIYTGVNTTVRILNNAISGYLYSVAPSSINGETTTRDGIFAPTEGGTSGQILQSNGNAEPTWITPNYVTAIDGKQLSTNDYTDEEKTKLQGIETGAEVNTIEQINVNGTNAQITNKTVNLNITDSSLIGNKINVSLNTSTYVMTISLLNSSDGILSTADIDFPLESVIVDGSYSNGTLTLELQNGTTIPIDISSIVNGLVPTSRTINGKSLTNNITLTAEDVDALPSTTNIPSSTSDLTNDSNFVSDSSYVHTDNNYTTTEKNKLAGIEAGAQVNPTSLSELAEDSTHRLVSDTEKTTWNNKANSIDLTAKLNINQGNSNSGKILQVNSSGNIEPVNLNKKYLHRITLNLSDQPSGSPPNKTAIIHLDYYSEQSTTFTDVNFTTIPYASPIGCTGYYLDTDVSLTQKNIVYEIAIPEASTFVINGNEVTIQIQSTGSTIQDEILGYILID